MTHDRCLEKERERQREREHSGFRFQDHPS